MTLTNDNETKYPELTPYEIWQSGMLRHINVTVLWPLGLALVVSKKPGTDEATKASGRLAIQDAGEVIQSGLSPEEAGKKADAWLAYVARRRASVAP